MKNKTPLPINKGETYTVSIEEITQKGQGICRIKGMTVFVNGGVPGDEADIEIILVKKNYAVGRIMGLITASAYRAASDCPYFPRCGGCQMRHISYEGQLFFKRKQVADALQRIGGIRDAGSLTKPVLKMDHPFRYRNKAQFKLNASGTGFYADRTHDIVAIKDCLNQPESCQKVIAAVNALISDGLMVPYDEITRQGHLRGVVQRSNRQGAEMITLIVAKDDHSKDDRLIQCFKQALPQLASLNINLNPSAGNVIFGEQTRCVYGNPAISEKLDDLVFELSPRSFFQVNTSQAEVLYRQVRELAALDGTQVVYDLFCGTGTIGLYLANGAKKVVGIEIIPEAVENAVQNAEKNKIDNAVFYCGKAEALFQSAAEQNALPDLVVVDPPRKGIDAHIIDLIALYNVPKVIYVSCNPATLARDAAIFVEKGYALDVVQPVDLFPGTGHVETVCLLSRNN